MAQMRAQNRRRILLIFKKAFIVVSQDRGLSQQESICHITYPSKCMQWGTVDKTVSYIVSGCE